MGCAGMKKPMFNEKVQVQVDRDLKKWLEEKAQERVLTLAELVRQLLRDRMLNERKAG